MFRAQRQSVSEEPEVMEEVDAEHLGWVVVNPHPMSKLNRVSCTIRDVNLD